MAIHIHLARAAKPVRDASKEEVKKRLDVARAEEKKLDAAASKIQEEGSALSTKYGGRANVPSHLLSENFQKYKEAMSLAKRAGVAREKIEEEYKKIPSRIFGQSKDSVESVEKEIRTQQRLIDVAKRMGKDVPGPVTQRMKFLQEELEKAKNPRTDDAEEFKPREEFKNVMLKSQDAFRAARNVVMLAGRAGDKGAAAKAQAIADLLDRAADMAHGLA